MLPLVAPLNTSWLGKTNRGWAELPGALAWLCDNSGVGWWSWGLCPPVVGGAMVTGGGEEGKGGDERVAGGDEKVAGDGEEGTQSGAEVVVGHGRVQRERTGEL